MRKLILLCLLAIFDLSAMHSGDKRKTETSDQASGRAEKKIKSAKSDSADTSSDCDSDAEADSIAIDTANLSHDTVVTSKTLPIRVCALSRDGTQAICVHENRIEIWNVTTNGKITEFQHPIYLADRDLGLAAFSPDHKYLAVVRNDKVALLDNTTYQVVALIQRCKKAIENSSKHFAYDLQFSPNGKHLYVASDNCSDIFPVPFRQEDTTLHDFTFDASPLFSTDGKYVVVIDKKSDPEETDNPEYEAVILFDGIPVQKIPMDKPVAALAANGKYLAIAGDNAIITKQNNRELCEIMKSALCSNRAFINDLIQITIDYVGKEFVPYVTYKLGEMESAHCISFSPDDKHLVFITYQQGNNEAATGYFLNLLSIETNTIVYRKKFIIADDDDPERISFLHNGKFFCVISHGNDYYIFHTATGALIKKENNKLLISADTMHFAAVTNYGRTNILTIQEPSSNI